MGESWKWRVATKIRCVMRCLRDRFSREICIEGVCVKDWYESLKTCYNRIWQNGGETRYVVLTILQCLSYTQALYHSIYWTNALYLLRQCNYCTLWLSQSLFIPLVHSHYTSAISGITPQCNSPPLTLSYISLENSRPLLLYPFETNYCSHSRTHRTANACSSWSSLSLSHLNKPIQLPL